MYTREQIKGVVLDHVNENEVELVEEVTNITLKYVTNSELPEEPNGIECDNHIYGFVYGVLCGMGRGKL